MTDPFFLFLCALALLIVWFMSPPTEPERGKKPSRKPRRDEDWFAAWEDDDARHH